MSFFFFFFPLPLLNCAVLFRKFELTHNLARGVNALT